MNPQFLSYLQSIGASPDVINHIQGLHQNAIQQQGQQSTSGGSDLSQMYGLVGAPPTGGVQPVKIGMGGGGGGGGGGGMMGGMMGGGGDSGGGSGLSSLASIAALFA